MGSCVEIIPAAGHACVTQFLSTESRLNVEPAAARNLNISEGGFNRSVGSKAEHNGWLPWVSSRNRASIEEVAPNFWRAEAHFGFMERPHIPELLTASKALGCTIDLDDVTYYVGHETVVSREDG